jgi:NAD-dependent DNA ligase
MSILSFFTSNTKPTGAFAGKVVAFTGTLQVGNRKMQRAEAQQIGKSLGGDVVTGESGKIRNANLLVVGERSKAYSNTKSQKMDRAAEQGVTTITAEQFFRMIAN